MYNCCENKSANRCCCLIVIFAIVAGLFTLALGLILGSVFAEFFSGVLAALVVLTIALFVMAVVILVYKACACYRN